MKKLRFFAAVLCAAFLAVGCSEGNSGQSVSSSSVSSSSSGTESSVSSSESSSSSSSSSVRSSSSSKSSSSKSSSSSYKSSIPVPTPTINTESVQVNESAKTLSFEFSITSFFRSQKKYYLRIYRSDNANSNGEVIYDKAFDTKSRKLKVGLVKGDNYIRIQFYTADEVGEISNAVHQYFKPVIKHRNFEFYTMVGAMYGEGFEMLFGYPDYTAIDSLLGVDLEPETMDVDVYYKCPYCRTKTFCATVTFSYREGEAQYIPNVHCSNPRCSHPNGSVNMLISRII